MSIDVQFRGAHITIFPWGLAAVGVSALMLTAAVIVGCEILYRCLRASRSK
jgi:hypothetical protein